MSAREEVLGALRRRPATQVEHPGSVERRADAEDLRALFAARLDAAGGRLEEVCYPTELGAAVHRHPAVSGARRIVSLLPETLESTETDAASLAPHDLEDLDFALFPGEVAVAENGAVWVVEPPRVPRAALFLARHVGLVVREEDLVSDLHAAYARLGRLDSCFGGFLTGPSKTADIEQALVVGAHGARSLTVWLRRAGSGHRLTPAPRAS